MDVLRKHGILKENEDLEAIRSDFHMSQFWADAFWARKDMLSRRPDPEIDVLKTLEFSSVLEIGSAYGRVAYKIIEEFPDIEYTGVEICTHFERYHEEYSVDKPHKMKAIFDNFFDTDTLDSKFDVVIIPMNTFPSFSLEMIPELIERVKHYLKPGGKFIFSNYKIMKKFVDIGKFRRNPFGELLIETSTRIALEIYQYELKSTDYGASSKNIHVYHRLDSNYNVLERAAFWANTEYYEHSFLIDFLKKYNFEVEFDDSSHSIVYIASIK